MKISGFKNLPCLVSVLAILLSPAALLRAQTTTTTSTTVVTSSTTTTTLYTVVLRRYFPKIVNSSTQATGLAVVSASNRTAILNFRAYSNSGVLLAAAQRSLQPGAQLVGLVGEVLPSLGDVTGWLVMESN